MVRKRKPKTGMTVVKHKRGLPLTRQVKAAAPARVTPRPKAPAAARRLSAPPTTQDSVRALVDKYCGPEGERIVQALSVIALGNGPSRMTFFGEPLKVAPKDRVRALEVLSGRRWGRPGITLDFDPGDPSRLPVQIVNIFTDSPDPDDA
jgi:hypothetical protein